METRTKEVFFVEYCPKCKHFEEDEGQDPCNDCLAYGYNEDSHKPVRFEEGETK